MLWGSPGTIFLFTPSSYDQKLKCSTAARASNYDRTNLCNPHYIDKQACPPQLFYQNLFNFIHYSRILHDIKVILNEMLKARYHSAHFRSSSMLERWAACTNKLSIIFLKKLKIKVIVDYYF